MSTFISRIIIIGIGLIGGSLALALKKRRLAQLIIGVDAQPDCLRKASDLGIVDRCATDIKEAFEIFHSYSEFEDLDFNRSRERPFSQSGCYSDLVVVCTPVGSIVDQILTATQIIENDTVFFDSPLLFTDVGSTKYEIAKNLQGKLSPHIKYVGSHPIAGSEKSGAEHADAELFAGHLTLLTPIDGDHIAEVLFLEKFWTQLGCSVIQIPPHSHDLILARTSHFPHLLSFLVLQLLKTGDHLAVGSGFRSFSRLAASDPTLWTDVFLSNRDAVSHAIDDMQHQLDLFRRYLEEEDRSSILYLLNHSKEIRDFLK